jgi:high-affinity iron transporter
MLTNNARRGLAVLVVALALGVAVVIVSTGGDGPDRSAAATTTGATTPPRFGPAALAHYSEGSPHVTSQVRAYAFQRTGRGVPTTPPDPLPPVSQAGFGAPTAAYLSYSVARLRLMLAQIARLRSALHNEDRAAAQTAWRAAYGYYLDLGAVYLEGPISVLNTAIDGTPGGLPGGVGSPQFSGLHRLEHGLWMGATLGSLEPSARALAADVTKLARMLPAVQILPGDYATRAHEILEDAVRDQLSGTDAPWSGAGVLGTSAGVVATTEVIKTLSPLLATRGDVLPTVTGDLAALRTTLASIARAHGGTLPTTSQLTQTQSEQLSGALGQALEGLAQVPGALETARAAIVPRIPAADARTAR